MNPAAEEKDKWQWKIVLLKELTVFMCKTIGGL